MSRFAVSLLCLAILASANACLVPRNPFTRGLVPTGGPSTGGSPTGSSIPNNNSPASDGGAPANNEGSKPGNGSIIDGDGEIQSQLERSMERIHQMLENTGQLTLQEVADLADCDGYGKTQCADQTAMPVNQRGGSAALAVETVSAVLPIFDMIQVVATTGLLTASDANGSPILVDSRVSPDNPLTVQIYHALVRQARLNAFDERKLEEKLLHEIIHIATHLGDYASAQYFSGRDQGRQKINGATRQISSTLYREYDAPACTIGGFPPSVTVDVEYDGVPLVSYIDLGFTIAPIPTERNEVTRATSNATIRAFNPVTGQATVRIPPGGTHYVTGQVRDQLTGKKGDCRANTVVLARSPQRILLYRWAASLGNLASVFSFTGLGSPVPPGWQQSGPPFSLLSKATPRCGNALRLSNYVASIGPYSGTGNQFVPAQGAALGYSCAPAAGLSELSWLIHRQHNLQFQTADPAERATALANGWSLAATLGYVFR